jgi:ATP-dependent Lon protease
VKVIDELRVFVDVETKTHVGVLQSLDIWAEVPVDIVNENRATLVTGMWGLVTVKKASEAVEVFGRPVSAVVADFEPFQSPEVDPKVLEDARPYFTLEEWVDVLINTIGLDPSAYSPRQKMVLLSRLIPVVEYNVSAAEFGPRQTGKTYLYRNLSNYVRIISGGNVSPAVLFYNLRTRVPGELAVKDLVVFDEISKVRFSNPDEMMGKLKVWGEAPSLAGSAVVLMDPEPRESVKEVEEGALRAWLRSFGAQAFRLRLSGHYLPHQFRYIVEALRPKDLIPLHTEEAELMWRLFKAALKA